MFFSLGEATSLGEGKLLNCLKIDLVSYPARAEGLVNRIFGQILYTHTHTHAHTYIFTKPSAGQDMTQGKFLSGV